MAVKLSPTSVVLADDHAMVRESLARVLEDSGSITVKGQASDGLQLLEVVRKERPDCVVLDYSMPKLDAPSAIERLVSEHKQVKILVLTVHENVHYAVRSLEAGAHGYMIKSAAVDELVDAIKVVLSRQRPISRRKCHKTFGPSYDDLNGTAKVLSCFPKENLMPSESLVVGQACKNVLKR